VSPNLDAESPGSADRHRRAAATARQATFADAAARSLASSDGGTWTTTKR
jgi:hypothetical protein